MAGERRRAPTRTSAFGSPGASHDASGFYRRFEAPEITTDDTVNKCPVKASRPERRPGRAHAAGGQGPPAHALSGGRQASERLLTKNSSNGQIRRDSWASDILRSANSTYSASVS